MFVCPRSPMREMQVALTRIEPGTQEQQMSFVVPSKRLALLFPTENSFYSLCEMPLPRCTKYNNFDTCLICKYPNIF